MVQTLLAFYEYQSGRFTILYRFCPAGGMALFSGGAVSLSELILCILLSMAIVGSLQTFFGFLGKYCCCCRGTTPYPSAS